MLMNLVQALLYERGFVMDEVISVIVLVYNAELYLGDCSNSILKQIYDKIVIIVVNNL